MDALSDGSTARAHTPSLADRLREARNVAGRLLVVPMLLPFLVSRAIEKDLILSDVRRWVELEELGIESPRTGLLHLLFFYREFRSLYYYRAKQGGTMQKVIVGATKILYKEPSWIAVRPRRLGRSLFIQHGVGANINGESIGDNCFINQQATIGYGNGPRLPRIGNNVHVSAGARVLGDVTVGDNVIIGANAVVTKNVPPNCTVVGVPAYIVRRDGVRVNQPL